MGPSLRGPIITSGQRCPRTGRYSGVLILGLCEIDYHDSSNTMKHIDEGVQLLRVEGDFYDPSCGVKGNCIT